VLKYTVKSGDTMTKIANAHGVTVGAMVRSNPQIDDPSLIFPGQKLNIPRPAGEDDAVEFTETYRVRSGDSMNSIARRRGVSLADLIAANPHITDPALIRPGDRLNVPPTDPSKVVQDITPPHGGSTPEWYRLARREMADGIVEFGDPGEHNPRILEYHATVPDAFQTNEVPWCSSFVNCCIEQCDMTGTDSAAARSWERWGKKLATPKPGAIAVFWRETKSSGLGHVGFYVKETSTSVHVLGGNQANRVSIEPYPKARLLSYRWPKG
jgi:uncharacterized protein (TIGR02594 family)